MGYLRREYVSQVVPGGRRGWKGGWVYAREAGGRWAGEANKKELRACDKPLRALEAGKLV